MVLKNYQNLYMKVQSNIIHNNQKVKMPKCPVTGEWIIQNVVQPNNGILFGHEKGLSTDTCYNMNRP